METKIFIEPDEVSSVFHYIPNVLSTKVVSTINTWLDDTTDFVECPSYHNDRNVRLQKWYQKDKKYFCPLWKNRYKRWESFDYQPILEKMEDIINDKLKSIGIEPIDFNSCLINKYRNGDDHIKAHRDSPNSFGEYPTVVGISFGTTRNIDFKRHEYETSDDDFSFSLEDNSMFIMSGASQKCFVHEVPKSETTDIRYSFTFRKFVL